MKVQPSHVAVLVPSVRRASEFLRRFGFSIGAEEEIASEGTREIYVESDKSNSLLLMEPIKPGPYRRAMEKRGPGLHHLAIDVSDLEAFLDSIRDTGWLLHPISIKTMKRIKLVYLARPGFPALIEVQERSDPDEGPRFVNRIHLEMPRELTRLLPPIGLKDMIQVGDGEAWLRLESHEVRMSDLTRLS